MALSTQLTNENKNVINTIITLFVCDNLSYKEIADITGVSLTSVSKWLNRYYGPKINTTIKTIQSTWSTE